ncbi:MAG: hypothetical protein OEM52_06600, partial [bacterium]|nr:hypothetical protein [bacterium]
RMTMSQGTFQFRQQKIPPNWMRRLFLPVILLVVSIGYAKTTLEWDIGSDTLDFGTRVAGIEHSLAVTLYNTGKELRTLDEWQAACPCLRLLGMPKELPAGQSALIQIYLKSEPIERGYYGSSLYILSDEPTTPILRLPIRVIWTDNEGSIAPNPADMPQQLAPENYQESSIPYQTPTPVSPEEQQQIQRDHNVRVLMSDPKFDSIVQHIPDSLREQFVQWLSSYVASNVAGTPPAPYGQQPPKVDGTNGVLYQSDSLIEKPTELTPRMFDSLAAILSGEEWIPPEVMEDEFRKQVQVPVVVGFFHSHTCRVCRKANERIERVVIAYGGRVLLKHWYTETDSGLARLIELQRKHQVRADPFLATIGRFAFYNLASLDSFQQYVDTMLALPIEERILLDRPQEAMDILRSTAQNLSFWTLVVAGLLDGINPCAFATLVFFLSMISYVGGKKRDLLLVGIPFTIVVFLTYLLLGIGAFGILTQLDTYRWISETLFIVTGVLLLVLIAFTLRDIWGYLNGAPPSEAILQLPTSLKRRIHDTMREYLKPGRLVFGSIVIGFLVTLFESVCTGQVYLPTIVMMLRDPQLSGMAWLNLVIYNLMFIAPLLVVFAFAYNGVSSKAIGDWSKRHYGVIKFLLLGTFILIFVMMLLEWLQ